MEVERLEGDNKYHAEEHGLQVSCCLYMITEVEEFWFGTIGCENPTGLLHCALSC